MSWTVTTTVFKGSNCLPRQTVGFCDCPFAFESVVASRHGGNLFARIGGSVDDSGDTCSPQCDGPASRLLSLGRV